MFKQIREAYKVTKEAKPWIGFALLAILISVEAIGILLGASAGHPIYAAFVSLPFAFLASLFCFSFIANRAAYSSIEAWQALALRY